MEIHRLHRELLDGIPGAAVRLNSLLAVCAMILPAKESSFSSDATMASSPSSSASSAHIVLECLCKRPEHDVRMIKRGYGHQFRHWRKCKFVHVMDPCATAADPKRARASRVNEGFVPLRIPIGSLIPRPNATPQYALMPDLGRFVRRVLLKRYFTDQSKRHWVRTASSHQILGGFVTASSSHGVPMPSSSSKSSTLSAAPSQHAGNPSDAAATASKQQWKGSNLLCTSLLHDSFPCLKKTKRGGATNNHADKPCASPGANAVAAAKKKKEKVKNTRASDEDDDKESDDFDAIEKEQGGKHATAVGIATGDKKIHGLAGAEGAGGRGGGASTPRKGCKGVDSSVLPPHTYDPVDVAACINVLYGTLLKLYPLGAKVPTFNAKVVMMGRLLQLSWLPTSEQVQFLLKHSALVRLCFMEYSLNAMQDWLPCEKDLFLSISQPMRMYCSVAIAVCDVFRQDHILHGNEDWVALNKAAMSSIDRCIRVCKFKAIKMPELAFKFRHMDASAFTNASLDYPFLRVLQYMACPGERAGSVQQQQHHQQNQKHVVHGGSQDTPKRRHPVRRKRAGKNKEKEEEDDEEEEEDDDDDDENEGDGQRNAKRTKRNTSVQGGRGIAGAPSAAAAASHSTLRSIAPLASSQRPSPCTAAAAERSAAAPFSRQMVRLAAALSGTQLSRGSEEDVCTGRAEHWNRVLQSCKAVQQAISVHPLPKCVTWMQVESIRKLHSACTRRMSAAHTLCFCVVCAVNGKGFQCKLRMCCVTGKLSCITCPPGTVVEVNMLGVLLKVSTSSFYMCPCCTGIRVWVGDGSDMHAAQCTCWKFGGLRSCMIAQANLRTVAHAALRGSASALCVDGCGVDKRDMEIVHFGALRSRSIAPCCLVCRSKTLCTRASGMMLPDPEKRVMRIVSMCNRHAPPDHIIRNVTSFEELAHVVQLYIASSAASKRVVGAYRVH
jgi:hypothetical protein